MKPTRLIKYLTHDCKVTNFDTNFDFSKINIVHDFKATKRLVEQENQSRKQEELFSSPHTSCH